MKYINSRVFVRRISPGEKVVEDSLQDPEYCDSPGNKLCLHCRSFIVCSVFGGKATAMSGDYLRRSSRRVKVRGEREFIVNSDMLLRDFKVKVGKTQTKEIRF